MTLLPKARLHHVLITGLRKDGFEQDLTDLASYSSDRPEVATVEPGGVVRGLTAGTATIRARVEQHTVLCKVKVEPAPADPQLSFVSDVMPVLSKAGCNAGSCHAKPEGQNGFKLSVFAYDPKSDYANIVKGDRGRRIFPAYPEESLFLKKPTMTVEHEGGQRFERGSAEYLILRDWIRQGMPFSQPDDPSLVNIKVVPAARRFQKGASQHLLVLADYADGTTRDVTHLADFTSNDKEMAKAGEGGSVKVGIATGEGVVIARYMGLVAVSRITVPADRALPEAMYASLPVNNEIDRLVYARLRNLGILPSDGCADLEFLRRASLDAIGILPSPDEVTAFLKDESGDKRARLIDRLLENPAYASYWAVKWGDLIRPNPTRVGVKPVYLLDQWLRETFQRNVPFDQMARELLTAEGNTHQYGPAALWRDKREPADAGSFVSQIFLGIRMDCARCHHHPNEKWSQADYYQLAAYFGPVKHKGQGISPPISGLAERIWFAPGGEVKHPVTGELMKPRPPDGEDTQIDPETDPRRAFFARAIVNRIWANFMGRGIVEPVDDFRASNPPTNEPLLEWMAHDFVNHGFDLKHLMRTIMQSHAYQLSSIPNEHNLTDTKNFSRAYRRRVSAEVMLDAVCDVTGVRENFEGLPVGARAMETWNHKLNSEFMDAFGRPNASAECPCERDTKTSVVQALHLMNSNKLQARIGNAEGRAAKLAASKMSEKEIVTELYLSAYSRPPADPELEIALKAYSAKEATRKSATEDIMWALINSAEFVFNH
jgi:hypothetical protein